jgi:hypothetical protein
VRAESFIFVFTFYHGGQIRFQSQPLQIAKKVGGNGSQKSEKNFGW